ncbi:hypothetical protein [Rhodococcus ruber]|uniref:hypothetical protein n=1 Tax=Rhodococcus ruber TaxID=1830 RepID=UPI00265FD6A8|nr:hypothetical protein [Rhodococcus ruber]
MDPSDLPKYVDLVVPAVRAVEALGGSAKASEIRDHIIENLDDADRMLAVTRPNRPDSPVLLERISWGRSYAKLIGALESPLTWAVSPDRLG